MNNKIMFLAVATVAALLFAPIAGAISAAVCYLAGMGKAGIVVVFGTAAVATFGAVMTLAGLAANLFFRADTSQGGGSNS